MSQEGFQNFNSNNFDPNSLANQTSDVIMFIVVNDKSPSITSYQDSMNTIARDVFMQELKNCHRKNDIVIKSITFNEKVDHKSGFMPILNLPDDYLDVRGSGSGTALYQAVLESLQHATKYRTDLEDQGINVRTCIFIITDGEDNSSPMNAANDVKNLVEGFRTNEAWISSFTINMLGVGNPNHFKNACIQMGLDPDKCLATVSNSAHEIRQQMGVISQSVSSSNAAATVSF